MVHSVHRLSAQHGHSMTTIMVNKSSEKEKCQRDKLQKILHDINEPETAPCGHGRRWYYLQQEQHRYCRGGE